MTESRNWSLLALLLALTLLGACADKPDPVDQPAGDVDYQRPAEDVEPTTTTAPVSDPVERPIERSLQEIQADAERQGLLGDVFFDFDRAELRPEARERLEKNAAFMMSEEGRDLVFTVEGHCDERGTNEYNLALGQERAAAATDYLRSLGVGESRFKTISYGEERPFCTVSDEACWQKNRRAHFVISSRR
ncbi:MAG: peptidoglycan-associated lipoprotein Pal [Acidobacteriota bacterium]